MAPTPLSTKGSGTLARKWRKLKKRCSSFSSGDNVSPGIARSKSMVVGDAGEAEDLHAEDVDEEVRKERYSSVGSQDGSRLQTLLRGKLSQLNSELRRRRRSSQGDSVSQWWHWNGSGSRDSTPNRSQGNSRAAVARSSSLKGILGRRHNRDSSAAGNEWEEEEEDGEDDDVFVRVDPILGRAAADGAMMGGASGSQAVTVKSASIVSAAARNPYCTGARASKKKSGAKATNKGVIVGEWESATTAATSAISMRLSPSPQRPQQQQQQQQQHNSRLGSPPSPPVSDDASDAAGSSNGSSSSSSGMASVHDHDSGYDGYCPSPSSASASPTARNNTSSSADFKGEEEASLGSSGTEESHYGNAASLAAAADSVSTPQQQRIMRNPRPQSVYEKQYGPVQHCLSLADDSALDESSQVQYQQQQQLNGGSARVSRATVVNLVNNGSGGRSAVVVSSPHLRHLQQQHRGRRELPPPPPPNRHFDQDPSVPPPLPPRPANFGLPEPPPPLPPPPPPPAAFVDAPSSPPAVTMVSTATATASLPRNSGRQHRSRAARRMQHQLQSTREQRRSLHGDALLQCHQQETGGGGSEAVPDGTVEDGEKGADRIREDVNAKVW